AKLWTLRRRRHRNLDPEAKEGPHVGFMAEEDHGAEHQVEAEAGGILLNRANAGQHTDRKPASALRERRPRGEVPRHFEREIERDLDRILFHTDFEHREW